LDTAKRMPSSVIFVGVLFWLKAKRFYRELSRNNDCNPLFRVVK